MPPSPQAQQPPERCHPQCQHDERLRTLVMEIRRAAIIVLKGTNRFLGIEQTVPSNR